MDGEGLVVVERLVVCGGSLVGEIVVGGLVGGGFVMEGRWMDDGGMADKFFMVVF